HINITLVEFTEAPASRAIRTPHRLNLIALEKLWQFVAIFRNNARERDRKVVTQGKISLAACFMNATFQNFEDELVPFFAVLPHQRFNVFGCRRFQRLKSVALKYLFDHTDNILTLSNISGEKITNAP